MRPMRIYVGGSALAFLLSCGEQAAPKVTVDVSSVAEAPALSRIEQSLPGAVDSEEDLLEVERVLKAVAAHLGRGGTVRGGTGAAKRFELPPSGDGTITKILSLTTWLKSQQVVADVQFPMHSAEGATALTLLTTHPAQLKGQMGLRRSDGTVDSYGLTFTLESEGLRFIELTKFGVGDGD